MEILLNKYNSILDSTDEEYEISDKDHEKISINTSTNLSNSSSTSDTLTVKDISISEHELDVQEPSSKTEEIS